MKLVAWIIRIVLFALLFVLALRNTADVSLQLFFDAVWRAPLILILLAAFGLGILAALAALAPALMRQRMEAGRLRRALGEARSQSAESARDPQAAAGSGIPYNVVGPKV
ncbi:MULTISPECIES: LapA family protein [Cupriavidus]|uniref:LapA family protein n=1 Tax=Cupriavidus TaxID=106589 RepID=UPI00296B0382|nr:LapA family protein [Cupriavidus sp. CV2]MDW3683408.1 LapA family protein [Cupriavidus sp. CV2]